MRAFFPVLYAVACHGQALRGNRFGVPGQDARFDYVVVGGGTAGAAVAARLAADPRGFSVALVEAGSFWDNGNLTEVPGYNGWSTHVDETRPSLNEWDFETTPQPGYNGRTIHYSQGRTLGGTSAINTLGYHRPSAGSLQMWADAVGDQSWTWDAVLPFYQKSCTFNPPELDKLGPDAEIPDESGFFAPPGQGGPIQISYGRYIGEYTASIAKGLDDLGLKRLPGLNSGDLLGHAPLTLTIDAESLTRTSATAFLESLPDEARLTIYHSTLAKKVLFDEHKKAVGVAVAAQGHREYDFVLSADKEVILSAGVFGSPQLLMLSGIGPRETLAQHSIPPVSVLEGVGQNLWDQPYFRLSYRVNVTTMTQLSRPDYFAAVSDEYLASRTGPLTTIKGGEVMGWEKLPAHHRALLSPAALTHLSTFPPDFPELELLPFNFGARVGGGDSAAPSPDENTITLAAGILAPRSRGSVSLRSADPRDAPVVDPNWLADAVDEELAVRGVARVREWAAAAATGVGGVVGDEVVPGPQVREEDGGVRAWLREAGALVFHATSTCKMGVPDDPMAVLDSAARVYGVAGLRVVDASSMPFLVPGHPMATVYMLAEKIAAAILDAGNDAPHNVSAGFEIPQQVLVGR